MRSRAGRPTDALAGFLEEANLAQLGTIGGQRPTCRASLVRLGRGARWSADAGDRKVANLRRDAPARDDSDLRRSGILCSGRGPWTGRRGRERYRAITSCAVPARRRRGGRGPWQHAAPRWSSRRARSIVSWGR
jgi:hypothetical protein